MAIKPDQRRLLRLIAIFKLFKAVALLLSLATVFRLIHHDDPVHEVVMWAMRLHLDPGAPMIGSILASILDLDARHFALIVTGTALYATLFVFEGIGLWLGRIWAEYLTIIATGSFIPVEVYEIFVNDDIGKIVVFGLNVAIVIYLIVQVRRE